MKDRVEISDWQVAIFVTLLMLSAVVIIPMLAVKLLFRWVRFSLAERRNGH